MIEKGYPWRNIWFNTMVMLKFTWYYIMISI